VMPVSRARRIAMARAMLAVWSPTGERRCRRRAWFTVSTAAQRHRSLRSRMREFRTSGSLGAPGEQSPRGHPIVSGGVCRVIGAARLAIARPGECGPNARSRARPALATTSRASRPPSLAARARPACVRRHIRTRGVFSGCGRRRAVAHRSNRPRLADATVASRGCEDLVRLTSGALRLRMRAPED